MKICEPLQDPIHLLIMDVVLPTMTGPDIANYITENYWNIPVLFMSGYDAETIRDHKLFDTECNFIQKPFGTLDILRKPQEAITQGAFYQYENTG